MPKTRLLTPDARMNEQLLATIDKYKRLARITQYGDLGPRIGKCATIISEQEYRKFGYDERKRILYQDSVVKCA